MQLPKDLSGQLLITDIRSLRAALAARRRKLGLTQLDLDALAFLTDSHTSRLECGTKNYGDVSLAATLAALGAVLVLVPVEDEQAATTRVAPYRVHPFNSHPCADRGPSPSEAPR
jgi:transcriptional regulator with XRE-family HTH domain